MASRTSPEYNKEYAKKNKDRIAIRTRKWRMEHREEICQRRKEYYLKNRESIRLKNRNWYRARHPVQIKEPNFIDEVGNKYHKLLVLSNAGAGRKKLALWECKCDCGNVVIIPGANLRNGHSKSCGCQRIESATGRKTEKGETSFKGLYRIYKSGASKRKLAFSLDILLFRKIVTSNCFYCGIEPSNEHVLSKRVNGGFKYNGIDRVDNDKGYTESNVVPCCKRCNYMKLNLGQDVFLEHIKKITLHLELVRYNQGDMLNNIRSLPCC